MDIHFSRTEHPIERLYEQERTHWYWIQNKNARLVKSVSFAMGKEKEKKNNTIFTYPCLNEERSLLL